MFGSSVAFVYGVLMAVQHRLHAVLRDLRSSAPSAGSAGGSRTGSPGAGPRRGPTGATMVDPGAVIELRPATALAGRYGGADGDRMTKPIAIVGMACRYPDASSSRRSCGRTCSPGAAPSAGCRTSGMRLEDYWSPDPAAPDRFYTRKAAVIEGFEFDRVQLQDRRQHLPRHRPDALAGARHRGPGARRRRASPTATGCPGGSTAVIVGNTLTGEFTRANLMRLRWPYVRRMVERRADRARLGRRRAGRRSWSASRSATRARSRRSTRTRWPAACPTRSPGRICNHFDLEGGGFTVDGACSSSLLSVVDRLRRAQRRGSVDAAIAGGVDLSIDPFEIIGFAKTGALATGEMRVYDKHSNGFWPGEGCGMLVLMRAGRRGSAGPADLRDDRRVGVLLRRQGRHHPAGGGRAPAGARAGLPAGRLRHRHGRLPGGARHRHRGRRRDRAAGASARPAAPPVPDGPTRRHQHHQGQHRTHQGGRRRRRADQGHPGRAPPGDPAGHRSCRPASRSDRGLVRPCGCR